MRYDWLDGYLLKKRNVTKDLQAGWNWVRYQIGGKMFVAVCLDREGRPYFINLKVDPAEGEFLRGRYEDIVPGYYSDKRNWISIRPDGAVPDGLLMDLVDKAYRLMLRGFSKKRQREILGLSCCGADCAACGFYQKDCAGCNESGGRVFHLREGKACPIFSCAVQKRRYGNCGECQELPCGLWTATRDPGLSEGEFEHSVRERIQNWKEL